MTKEELKYLVKEKENVELKFSLSLSNEIIECVSAFANRIAQNTDPRIYPRISIEDMRFYFSLRWRDVCMYFP